MPLIYLRRKNNGRHLIYHGLKKGLDVSIYAKPEFNYSQMHRVYLKLKYGQKLEAIKGGLQWFKVEEVSK